MTGKGQIGMANLNSSRCSDWKDSDSNSLTPCPGWRFPAMSFSMPLTRKGHGTNTFTQSLTRPLGTHVSTNGC